MAGVGIGLHRVVSKLLLPAEMLSAEISRQPIFHEPAIARSKAYLPSVNGVEHGEARGRHMHGRSARCGGAGGARKRRKPCLLAFTAADSRRLREARLAAGR